MEGDKEFEATQSRLDKARRDGDVARSQELSTVAAFAAGLIAAAAVAAPISSAASVALESAASGSIAFSQIAAVVACMCVPAACAALASCTAGIAQAGGLRFIAISCKPERLNPSENLRRMLSRESAITAMRATLAFACAGAAVVPAFAGIYAAALQARQIESVATAAWNGSLHTALAACAVGAAFACADYGVQYASWRKRLRMSRDELKRDQKEQDGDPAARGRRRALHRQISRGSLTRVKDAAFVVTNPTHIAVALEYRPPDVAVPRIIVRAADDAARRVRELACEYRIPVIEDVPLARLLFAQTEPGQYIPHETYVAVAEIVSALVKSGMLR